MDPTELEGTQEGNLQRGLGGLCRPSEVLRKAHQTELSSGVLMYSRFLDI